MAKYIVKRKPLEVDLGEGQILFINKPGFIKLLPLLEDLKNTSPSDNAKKNIDFICDIVCDWKGFVDEDGVEVKFEKSILKDLLESLSAEDYITISNKITEIIKDVIKVAEEKEKELKN